MIRILLLLFISLQFSGCTQPEDETSLSGKWRENKNLTLQSVDKSTPSSEELLRVLNVKSFGNSIYEFEDKKARLSVVDTGSGYDFLGEFRDFEVLEENSNFIVIDTYDIVSEKNTKQKLYWHSNCFYLYYQKRNFNHYYCKENGI